MAACRTAVTLAGCGASLDTALAILHLAECLAVEEEAPRAAAAASEARRVVAGVAQQIQFLAGKAACVEPEPLKGVPTCESSS